MRVVGPSKAKSRQPLVPPSSRCTCSGLGLGLGLLLAVRARARARARTRARGGLHRIDANAQLVAQPLHERHVALLEEAVPVHHGVGRLGDEDVAVGAQQYRKRRQMRRDALICGCRPLVGGLGGSGSALGPGSDRLVGGLGASGSARGPGSDRPPRRSAGGGVRGVRDREKSVYHRHRRSRRLHRSTARCWRSFCHGQKMRKTIITQAPGQDTSRCVTLGGSTQRQRAARSLRAVFSIVTQSSVSLRSPYRYAVYTDFTGPSTIPIHSDASAGFTMAQLGNNAFFTEARAAALCGPCSCGS